MVYEHKMSETGGHMSRHPPRHPPRHTPDTPPTHSRHTPPTRPRHAPDTPRHAPDTLPTRPTPPLGTPPTHCGRFCSDSRFRSIHFLFQEVLASFKFILLLLKRQQSSCAILSVLRCMFRKKWKKKTSWSVQKPLIWVFLQTCKNPWDRRFHAPGRWANRAQFTKQRVVVLDEHTNGSEHPIQFSGI